MKGNKGIYILLPVVAIIWIVIGFRVVKYINGDGHQITAPKPLSTQVAIENIQSDTFSISANYRDPFLAEVKAYPKVVTPIQTQTPKPPPRPAVKNEVPYPNVVYRGLVRNNKSNMAYGLISIDGKAKTLAEKDEVNGLKVVSITRDSVITSFNKHLKSFKKK